MQHTNKVMNISLWVVSGLLAALFLVAGGAKFIGVLDDQFARWGYTAGFAAIIGILEVAGAIGLLIKRTAGWSAVGLMVIMLGAIWTYAVHREYMMLIAPAVLFVVLGFVAWGRGLTWETRQPRGVRRRSAASPT